MENAEATAEIYVSGTKIPYSHDWLYRVSWNGVVKDTIQSKRKWTTQEMLDVQTYYTESLNGYVLGGIHISNYEGSPNPTIRPPVFQPRRRTARPVS